MNKNKKQHKVRTATALGAVVGVTVLDLIASTLRSAPVDPTGHTEQRKRMRGKAAITVRRPAEEVYRHRHEFSKPPTFMAHLESVQPINANRSKWTAKGPARTVEWQAEIIDDPPKRVHLVADGGRRGRAELRGALRRRTRRPGTEVTVELD